MSRLRVRWAAGPDDVPAPGESVARMSRIPGSTVVERYPRAGRRAPALVWQPTTGELHATADQRSSDLVLARSRMQVTLTVADGRQLVAHFGPDASAPQIDADAPPDLRDAMVRACLARPPVGRPPGITTIESDEEIWQAIRDTRRAGRRFTERNVAAVGGTFTYANLRSYLNVTGRSWRELLDTFLAQDGPNRDRSSPGGKHSTGSGKP